MTVREEPGTFRHEDRRLAYRIYGDGPRLTVLLHGLLLSQRMHVPLARALAERGNRIVTLDLRGHGRSDRPRHALGGQRAAAPHRTGPSGVRSLLPHW